MLNELYKMNFKVDPLTFKVEGGGALQGFKLREHLGRTEVKGGRTENSERQPKDGAG